MTKEKKITYHIEGPDWTREVELDSEDNIEEEE